MSQRLKLKEKLELEENEEEEETEKKLKQLEVASSDDEEANEDLSLKIVEKHLLMRAAKLAQEDDDDEAFLVDEKKNDHVVDLASSSLLESEVIIAGPSSTSDDAITQDVKSDKKRVRVRKKKKMGKVEIGDQSAVAKEAQKVETIENGEEAIKSVETVEVVDPNSVEITDNIVLRKLLRGPRYFDPPDSGWETCYNCGEEGHMAVNCTSALKRKKPCFICGSLDHGAKQCSKAQDCFVCKKGGHRAKDCLEKYKSSSHNAKICLKCGDSGHDMFSCRNNYSFDDLKEIQCYVCKNFGHLCCVNVAVAGSSEVSCFKCGQMGHTGLACARSRGETTDSASPGSCYRCGGEGHFARECVSSAKVRKKKFDSSTRTLRPHGENKDNLGFMSAPRDLGKGQKRKKTQKEEKGFTTPRKSKQRGGWITEDPGEFSKGKDKRNHWRSPATPSSKSHRISAITAGGRFSSPQSSKRQTLHHRFAASRFDNSGSNEIRKYDWW